MTLENSASIRSEKCKCLSGHRAFSFIRDDLSPEGPPRCGFMPRDAPSTSRVVCSYSISFLPHLWFIEWHRFTRHPTFPSVIFFLGVSICVCLRLFLFVHCCDRVTPDATLVSSRLFGFGMKPWSHRVDLPQSLVRPLCWRLADGYRLPIHRFLLGLSGCYETLRSWAHIARPGVCQGLWLGAESVKANLHG